MTDLEEPVQDIVNADLQAKEFLYFSDSLKLIMTDVFPTILTSLLHTLGLLMLRLRHCDLKVLSSHVKINYKFCLFPLKAQVSYSCKI